MKKTLLVFAIVFCLILPALADQMGPIGSELYEEDSLWNDATLSQIIFRWTTEDYFLNGVLNVEIFGDLDSEQEFVSVYGEDGSFFAELNGGTQFEQTHSYSFNWVDSTWAFDHLISFVFIPTMSMDPGDSFSPVQTDFIRATLNASPVPEPSTMLLLGMGLIGLGGWGRRRIKKNIS